MELLEKKRIEVRINKCKAVISESECRRMEKEEELIRLKQNEVRVKAELADFEKRLNQ